MKKSNFSGMRLRVFLVNDDDAIERLALSRYDRWKINKAELEAKKRDRRN